jgi:phospholipid/cholesterol/gamma-HCH transport system permease protein
MVLLQMEAIGVRSIPIVFLTAMFTGMVLVLQTAVGLARYGAEEQSSGVAALAFAREMGPVLTALIVAGRVGAGIAAEVGTMKVTEQIDALRTLAANPVHYLVVPRVIAAALMLPILTICGDVVGLFGGYVVGVYSIGIPSTTYTQIALEWLQVRDVASGIIKTPLFGVIIGVISCYHGFEATGGAEGVGRATTRAVVWGSILILTANYIQTDIILRYTDTVANWITRFLP